MGHLSAAQGYDGKEASPAALEDGAHSAQKPLLPTLPGKMVRHAICGLHHNCTIA